MRQSHTRVLLALLSGQLSAAHQIAITFTRRTASLVEGPDYQALATSHIACGKDTLDIGHIGAIFSLGVRACIPLNAKLCTNGIFWTKKSHGQEHQVGWPDLFGPRYSFGDKSAPFISAPLDVNRMQFLDVAMFIADELFGHYQVRAGVCTKVWAKSPGLVKNRPPKPSEEDKKRRRSDRTRLPVAVFALAFVCIHKI